MNMNPASDCWNFFDRMYCISLEDRPDRRAEARKQFRKVGLENRVEFVVVKRNTQNSEQGIFESHMDCIRRGIQANVENMIIFEDDIVFERFDARRLKRCVQFLSQNRDWKAFFLGCLVTGSRPTKSEAVLKIKYRSLAHAYALNRPFAERLLQQPWRNIPFDSMLCRLDCEQYTIYPSIAFQNNTRTDNQRFVQLDKYRRLCGGLRGIQKMNELYYRRTFLVILLHVLGLYLFVRWVLG